MTERSSSEDTSTQLRWIADMARKDSGFRFTNLAHHLSIERLREAHRRVRRDGASGVDRVTAAEYDRHLGRNLAALHARLKSGTYRAPPVRRVQVPKGRGKTRPIGIPTFEDKIVQRAVLMLLEPIYEQDFLDCSWGFRRGRSPHQALDRLWHDIMRLGGGWVLDVDLEDFFGSLEHGVLRDLLGQRIGDGRILRLIGKWLKAGVMEEARLSYPERGTPQGGVVSPLLGNVYLHYVLDVWFQEQVKPRLCGPAELVRFADDAVIVCAREDDARRVWEVLPKRLARFGLRLNADKTRLLRFVRPPQAVRNRDAGRGPSSFDFLGLTHYWKRSHRGSWVLTRKTAKTRFARAVTTVHQWCRRHRHDPLPAQHRALCQKLQGHYAYYGVRGNFRALSRFRHQVARSWLKWLQRRSQRAILTREQRGSLLKRWPLPTPRIRSYWTGPGQATG